MAFGWYIVPYGIMLRRVNNRPARWCRMNEFNAIIRADRGQWAESEILGDRAIVKVRADPATLATIAGTFRIFPLDNLLEGFNSLTVVEQDQVRNDILDAGYTTTEFQGRFGSTVKFSTLDDVCQFMTTRRRMPRYDPGTDMIVMDGDFRSCKNILLVDREVSSGLSNHRTPR